MTVTMFGRKSVPLWVILLILVPLTASVVFAASSIGTRSVTNISGEVLTVSEGLDCTPNGITVVSSNASANAGNGTEVAMDAGTGQVAREALTQGHYAYNATVAVVNASNSTEYSAELFEDGVSQGTLYIEQAAAAVAGDDVYCYWDLGTSIASHVYHIEVKPQ
jgi:hypothetical protein